MLMTVGKFPAQVQCYTLWQNLQFSPKPQFSFLPHLNLHAFPGKLRSGFCLKSKTQKKGDFNSPEMDGLDDFEDDFDDDEMFVDIEDDDDGEFEGEDDEVIVPLENMKRWLENRPSGFGEGKVYDTSIEDKLVEELEQSRQAQLANVNNLKHNPIKPSPKKETSQQAKAVAHIQDGFRVRLVNLPKKKNIHRDLQLAFKGVTGIVNITPLVSGNEKTRDPVCKGIAFVDFKYEDQALRFVQDFSSQSINFGKVEKKIKCEMMKSILPKPSKDQSVETDRTLQQTPSLHKVQDTGVDPEIPLINLQKKSVLRKHDYAEERQLSAQSEDDTEIMETSSTSKSRIAVELVAGEKSTVNPSSSKRGKELKPSEEKVAAKRKKDKIPKLHIPGSANRLKLREKAMLTDVFSKYGSNATLTVKEHSK